MFNLRLSSEFVKFENCARKKNGDSHCNAWYCNQWSHKRQYMKVYELWHRKWVVWHMNKWSYIYSVILWTYRFEFLGNLRVFLFLPLAASCTLQRNNFDKGRTLPTANYTFAYEMIRITKRCVTFNKYARNFNFHNEMKTTITLLHTPMLRCLSQVHETHEACIYI